MGITFILNTSANGNFPHVGNLIAFLALTFLEIVLGVDNILFISIVSYKLIVEQQAKAGIRGCFLL